VRHSLPWRPRFRFGIGGDVIDWKLRLPQRPWTPDTPTVGGTRTAAGGIPAGYVVRRDYNLEVTLRLYPDELANLDRLIAWGQPGESFRFYPDRDQASYHTVYLEEPKAGGQWRPNRVDGYEKVFEMTLLLRLTTGGPWSLDYFDNVNNGASNG
jgi:hypothetical protein